MCVVSVLAYPARPRLDLFDFFYAFCCQVRHACMRVRVPERLVVVVVVVVVTATAAAAAAAACVVSTLVAPD